MQIEVKKAETNNPLKAIQTGSLLAIRMDNGKALMIGPAEGIYIGVSNFDSWVTTQEKVGNPYTKIYEGDKVTITF